MTHSHRLLTYIFSLDDFDVWRYLQTSEIPISVLQHNNDHSLFFSFFFFFPLPFIYLYIYTHAHSTSVYDIYICVTAFRAQELCESRGGRPGLPVPNSPYGLCGRKPTLNLNVTAFLSSNSWGLMRFHETRYSTWAFILCLICRTRQLTRAKTMVVR